MAKRESDEAIIFLRGPTSFFIDQATYCLGPQRCYYCEAELQNLTTKSGLFFACRDCCPDAYQIVLDGTPASSSVVLYCLRSYQAKQRLKFRKNETLVFTNKTKEYEQISALRNYYVCYYAGYYIFGYITVVCYNYFYVVRDIDVQQVTLKNVEQFYWLDDAEKLAAMRLPFHLLHNHIDLTFRDILTDTDRSAYFVVVAAVQNRFTYIALQDHAHKWYFCKYAAIYGPEHEALNYKLFGCSIMNSLPKIDGFFGQKLEMQIEQLQQARILIYAMEAQELLASANLQEFVLKAYTQAADNAKVAGFLRYLAASRQGNANPDVYSARDV